MTPGLSRRRVLAGLGAAGSLALGAGFYTAVTRARPYTKYTYAQTDETGGSRLRVAWYESYNGQFLEAQTDSTETNATRVLETETAPEYVPEATGPVVSVGNVMPGDTGTLVVGLQVESIAEGEEGLEVWFRPTLTDDLENGVNEPERRDPDEDDTGDGLSRGELGRAMESNVWRDSGLVGGVGACDGARGAGETPFESGSLVETFEALREGVQIAPCLGEGERRCFGFEWSLPVEPNNAVQTDSVAFDLVFVGVSCESPNPFASDGGTA
ncbi:MAG: hypothetical protein ACI8XM_000417 [Haloarculaceae archaeon]|jgi:hypothetical protein